MGSSTPIVFIIDVKTVCKESPTMSRFNYPPPSNTIRIIIIHLPLFKNPCAPASSLHSILSSTIGWTYSSSSVSFPPLSLISWSPFSRSVSWLSLVSIISASFLLNLLRSGRCWVRDFFLAGLSSADKKKCYSVFTKKLMFPGERNEFLEKLEECKKIIDSLTKKCYLTRAGSSCIVDIEITDWSRSIQSVIIPWKDIRNEEIKIKVPIVDIEAKRSGL